MSPLATHVLPSLSANDIAPSVGLPQQEDISHKVSESDNPLTPTVPIHKDRYFVILYIINSITFVDVKDKR